MAIVLILPKRSLSLPRTTYGVILKTKSFGSLCFKSHPLGDWNRFPVAIYSYEGHLSTYNHIVECHYTLSGDELPYLRVREVLPILALHVAVDLNNLSRSYWTFRKLDLRYAW